MLPSFDIFDTVFMIVNQGFSLLYIYFCQYFDLYKLLVLILSTCPYPLSTFYFILTAFMSLSFIFSITHVPYVSVGTSTAISTMLTLYEICDNTLFHIHSYFTCFSGLRHPSLVLIFFYSQKFINFRLFFITFVYWNLCLICIHAWTIIFTQKYSFEWKETDANCLYIK